MNEILDAILGFIEDVPPVLRVVLTGIAIMLETSVLIGLIVPGDTIVLFSSTGVTTVLEFIFTVVAVVVGALLGSSFGFWIGRIFGPKLRGSWLGVRIGEDRWQSGPFREETGRYRSLYLPVPAGIPLCRSSDSRNVRDALPVVHELARSRLDHLGVSLCLDWLRCR